VTEHGGQKLLLSARSSTGYLGVRRVGQRFQASRGRTTLGSFGTVLEAAVAVARHVASVGGGGAAAARRETPHFSPLSPEVEGTLLFSLPLPEGDPATAPVRSAILGRLGDTTPIGAGDFFELRTPSPSGSTMHSTELADTPSLAWRQRRRGEHLCRTLRISLPTTPCVRAAP
jgi:hypothetical protein